MKQLLGFLLCLSVGFVGATMVAYHMAPTFGNNPPSRGASMVLIQMVGLILGGSLGLVVASHIKVPRESPKENSGLNVSD